VTYTPTPTASVYITSEVYVQSDSSYKADQTSAASNGLVEVRTIEGKAVIFGQAGQSLGEYIGGGSASDGA
jgi:hypothetical protein